MFKAGQKWHAVYTGYVPQWRYRIGETFGKTTHKIMMDPHTNMADQLVLSDRSVDNYQIFD
ncbi:hypothetical protein FOCC_FOCC011924 [Frankliniella occidentalis]|nr:hypothetical protein FOCC_FOCC011924 [Frankliniella occidentalis]